MRLDDSIDEDAPTQVFTRSARRPWPCSSDINDNRLWDVKDVARYMRVSRSWVYHRAEAGLLPYRRIGGLLSRTTMGAGRAAPAPRRTRRRRPVGG